MLRMQYLSITRPASATYISHLPASPLLHHERKTAHSSPLDSAQARGKPQRVGWKTCGGTGTPAARAGSSRQCASVPSNMGAGASRELELAQGQVKRLSSEMQRLTASLQARESKLSDVLREASEMRKYKDQLAVARRDLDAASADLRAARRAAHELPGVSAELQTAKGAAAMESRRVAELQSELQASRDELEETVGKLKYAEQEQRSLARKIGTKAMTEEQKQLAAAQEEAAVVSAQIVSEVRSPE